MYHRLAGAGMAGPGAGAHRGQSRDCRGKKGISQRKNLREICLPPGLRSIGDWAFAYCNNLERVLLPAGCDRLGKALFLDCGHLDCVEGACPDAEEGERRAWTPEVGRLLAAAVIQMEAYYLLEPKAVGSPEWLRKWDLRLEAVMRAGDQEGYSRQVLCGEEDYGSTDLDAFLRAKRQKKVRLAMLRLLCGEGLSPDMRQYLEQYLISHTMGCESEETWQVVLAEGEERPEYVQLFLGLGCAGRENIESMIRQMGKTSPGCGRDFCATSRNSWDIMIFSRACPCEKRRGYLPLNGCGGRKKWYN